MDRQTDRVSKCVYSNNYCTLRNNQYKVEVKTSKACMHRKTLSLRGDNVSLTGKDKAHIYVVRLIFYSNQKSASQSLEGRTSS